MTVLPGDMCYFETLDSVMLWDRKEDEGPSTTVSHLRSKVPFLVLHVFPSPYGSKDTLQYLVFANGTVGWFSLQSRLLVHVA